MHIQAAVVSEIEDPGRHKEAEGHGDDEGYGVGRGPACECVDWMGWEIELSCGVVDGCWRRWLLAYT